MTLKDKNLETDGIFAPVAQHYYCNSIAKKFAKIANIFNYVLPLPMIQSFHGNTF